MGGGAVFAAMTPLENTPQPKYLMEQPIEDGWNLLPCFTPGYIQSESDIRSGDIRVIWIYITPLKQYFRLHPETWMD